MSPMRIFSFHLLFLLFLFTPHLTYAEQPPARYAVAVDAAPVLNTPSFSKIFGAPRRLDPCRGTRPIEFVALPGTLFRIVEEENDGGVPIYRVTTHDYPYDNRTGYYVDSRFVQVVDEAAATDRKPVLPTLEVVQRGLLASLGRPYIWGGNERDGVPLLRRLYPEGNPLAGVDCTGLLYQATDGYTPRNSSALTSFGTGVRVAGLSAEEIANRLHPLDLVTWNGHVMIVLDGDSIIQSRMGCRGGGGVVLSPLKETLRRLMKSRKPRDQYPKGEAGRRTFVVRRWFPR